LGLTAGGQRETLASLQGPTALEPIVKAVGFSRYGSADRLALRELPTPEPKDDELLIRVHASSVNSWDWELLSGTLPNRAMFGLCAPRASNQILGADVSGVVDAVGSRVTRFRPGDAVFGDLWDRFGGFAEYACAPEGGFEPKPPAVSHLEAACVPQAGVLALQALRAGDGALLPGQRVLVNGGGGGVGSFAIQLAKLAGAEVTGADAAHKQAAMRSVGADHVLDYAAVDFTNTGERYDRIVDCQNRRAPSRNRRALRPGGTFAMVGGTRLLSLLVSNRVGRLRGDDRQLLLVTAGPNRGLDELAALVEVGELVPMIDRSYALDQVPEAIRYFAEGRHRGKLAIAIAGDSA